MLSLVFEGATSQTYVKYLLKASVSRKNNIVLRKDGFGASPVFGGWGCLILG